MHSFLAFIILLLVLVLNFGMSSFYLTVFFLYLFEQAELGNAKAVYFHAKKKIKSKWRTGRKFVFSIYKEF